MPKALFIYGTRPEAIELAPVILECRKRGALEAVLCVTAQHRELLDEINQTFDLVPDYDLGLMRPDQTLPALTASAIGSLSEIIAAVKPQVSVVQGDTTTAMAGALASFYHRAPVAHVEAGLRTDDSDAPFPEEMNRQVIARMTRWHFAPTDRARENLLRENIAPDKVMVTGNTSIDALQIVAGGNAAESRDSLARLGLARPSAQDRLIVVTAHRRESFGQPFVDLCASLRAIVDRWPNVRIVYPVHPNPNVRAPVAQHLRDHPRIHLVDPMGYRMFVGLLRDAWLVLTDSGGIQEEAPGLGKPVLVLRETTERPEAVAAGTARLVGTSPERIAAAVAELMNDPAVHARMANAHNPFGDGQASARIVGRLAADLS